MNDTNDEFLTGRDGPLHFLALFVIVIVGITIILAIVFTVETYDKRVACVSGGAEYVYYKGDCYKNTESGIQEINIEREIKRTNLEAEFRKREIETNK